MLFNARRVCHKIDHTKVKYITEEQLSILQDPSQLIAHPQEDSNYVVVSPCLKNYNDYKANEYPNGESEWVWGDYTSYTDPGWVCVTDVNNQQLLYNLRYLLTHLSDNGCYNVHVFYISAQRYNFEFLQFDNFTFIELDEYYGEYWDILCELNPNFIPTTDYTNKQYHFCNLNHRPDLYRQKWFYEILFNEQLKQTSIFSYVGHTQGIVDEALFSKFHFEAGRLDNPHDYLPLIPYYSMTGIEFPTSDQKTMYLAWSMPDQVIEKSFICVVNETFFHAPYDPIFTEKIFKPIFYKMPFILFGCPGALKKLRSIGFKTFEGIIDESYDLELNHDRRFNMIVKECNRLANIPLEEIANLIMETQPILDHNKKRLEELKHELSSKVDQIDKFILSVLNGVDKNAK